MHTEIEYLRSLNEPIDIVNKNYPYMLLTMKGIYREHDGYCSGVDERSAEETEVD